MLIRDINIRRRLFIIFTVLLVWTGLSLDVLFVLKEWNPWLMVIFLVQPCLYYIYYQVAFTVFNICGGFRPPYITILLTYVVQAPVYVIMAELKLMISRFYKLAEPITHKSIGDRLRHHFFIHMIIHCVFHTFPMTVLQFYLYFDGFPSEFLIISPLCNLIITLYGFFLCYLFAALTTTGVKWLYEPKISLVNHISKPGTPELVNLADTS